MYILIYMRSVTLQWEGLPLNNSLIGVYSQQVAAGSQFNLKRTVTWACGLRNQYVEGW